MMKSIQIHACFKGIAISFIVCTHYFIQAQEFLPLVAEKLDASINSPGFDESAPVISLDGKTLFFTRTAHPDFVRTLMMNGNDASQTMDALSYEQKLRDIYSRLSGYKVAEPSLSPFNQDIWKWDVSSVDLSHMFWWADSFEQNLCPWIDVLYNRT